VHFDLRGSKLQCAGDNCIRWSGTVSFFIKYYYGDEIKDGVMDRDVARMGKARRAYRIAGVKSEGNRPLRTPR
jgi:hypothetical protein